jgi:RNA polymerase sigma-70 factor (ECF subfamily)
LFLAELQVMTGEPPPIRSSPAGTNAHARLSARERVSTEVSSAALEPGLLTMTAEGTDDGVRSVATGATDDAAVMLRVKAGDDDAFDFLVQKYRRAMIHFLYRSARDRGAAEELAQEVFLRVYRSRQSYEASAKFSTWLYRIATNLAMNHARDTKYERPENTVRVDEKDEETGQGFDLADHSLSVEQKLLRQERLAAIRQKVMSLPERQRMAVIMHKYQSMDYAEIGAVLKLSDSATKSLLFRAYQTLREELREFL